MENQNSIQTEDVYTSPSERMKNIILNKLEECERYFSQGDTEKFINATKSLKRLAFMQIRKDFKKKLLDLDIEEKEKIEVIWKKKESDMKMEEKKKVRKEVLSDYATQRMELLIDAISNSPIIEKDMEVDFNISENMEVLRQLVKEPIDEGDNSERFV